MLVKLYDRFAGPENDALYSALTLAAVPTGSFVPLLLGQTNTSEVMSCVRTMRKIAIVTSFARVAHGWSANGLTTLPPAELSQLKDGDAPGTYSVRGNWPLLSFEYR